MAQTDEQERAELELRMVQMQTDIDLKQAQIEKSKQDWRLDPQRVVIQAVIATAAVMGAVGTLFGYLLRGTR